MLPTEGIPYLKRLLAEIRQELFPPFGRRRRTINVDNRDAGLRTTVVTKLVGAIEEVEELAKRAGRRSRKGGGGVSPKIRWYQLMAYLAQTLDGVLKNSDMEKFEGRMSEMEKMVEELQRTSQHPA